MKAAELAALLGTGGERVAAGGRDLLLRPLTLAQIAEALEVLDRMAARGAVGLSDAGSFNPLRVLLRGGRDTLELLAIALCDPRRYLEDPGKEKAEYLTLVRGLDPAEGAKLLGAAWRVNSDFFTRNRETMAEALGAMGVDASRLVEAVAAKAVELLLRLVSSSSSPGDTVSTTSEATPSVS